jgi:Zn-dependent protease
VSTEDAQEEQGEEMPPSSPNPPLSTQTDPRTAWRSNLGLFIATACSVFVTGILNFPTDIEPIKDEGFIDGLKRAIAALSGGSLVNGAQFAGTLLTILVAHELGHYVMARIHKVDASLPFFIPLPLLSPFGTMGAVIRMRGVIPTRKALLDIGASGPLAGMLFAIPLYAYGVSKMKFIPADPALMDLGESLLIKGLDRFFAPPTPEGMVGVYSPIAFGAWGGFFVTMINMLPVSQLDGGHVAYALFGPKQDRFARFIHRAMLVFFGVIIVGHIGRDLSSGRALTATLMGRHIGSALSWLVWFQLLAVLGTIASASRQEEEKKDDNAAVPTLTIRTRIIATAGLLGLAWMARSYSSWLSVAAFFIGVGMLVAMEVKGGVLRNHNLLDHPKTGPDDLSGGRKVIAIVTLILFGLLFMPEPFSL